jgi:ribokinase
MKKTVSVIGALNVDLIIRGNAPTNLDDLVEWTGASEVWCITAGSVGYLIQDLIKLDFKVNVLSTTSDDPFSLIIRDSLKKLGINTDFIRREENTLSGIAIYNTLARKPPTSVVGMNRQKAYLKVGYINSCW